MTDPQPRQEALRLILEGRALAGLAAAVEFEARDIDPHHNYNAERYRRDGVTVSANPAPDAD